MRFITEFELKEFDRVKLAYIVDDQKFIRENEIGKSIGKAFGFENPVNGNDLHYKLEIEAFSIDKWVEFKQKLFTHIYEEGRRGVVFNQIRVLELIKELESFSKPAGEAKQQTHG